MMFTEGLDENAINWVKQGTDVSPQPRSPLIEKYPMDDPVANIPLCYRTNSFLSGKVLPPTRYNSVFHIQTSVDSEDELESVASVSGNFSTNYSDMLDEEGIGCSSDSELFERPWNQTTKLRHEILRGPTLVRGSSKENLTVDVAGKVTRIDGDMGLKRVSNVGSALSGMIPNSRGSRLNNFSRPTLEELGTPSAPPIAGIGRENKLDLEVKSWTDYDGEPQDEFIGEVKQAEPNVIFNKIEISADRKAPKQKTNEKPPRSISGEGQRDVQVPNWQTHFGDQIPSYNTSVQGAWQTFVAYDACFRLCLYAWARNCMEAPEFLRDECMILRNAFGLQNFLLQPRGRLQEQGKEVENTDGVSTVKGRKMIGQIEVEVKRIRIIPQRKKLRATSSQRVMQLGAQYVRHVSMMLKSQINSFTSTSFPVAPEESMSCLLQLKSSVQDAPDTGSSIYVKPGTGDSHVFYPESLGDALLVEVEDQNKLIQGRATIPFLSLTDIHGEITKWWPLYMDQGCVGKVQLFISISGTSDNIGAAKAGPAVETLIYDLVLEAALRAQHFHPRNLHINGIWKWLLDEFANYYGVSDAYAKLRYLSTVMYHSTPTRDCLELVHELLLPILKARSEKILTRQERSILLDCEEQIKNLLATTFENYKSLDELSPTGLTELPSQQSESAAPALAPAVQIFSLLHDILSQEAQSILRNYFQSAATKRCRRTHGRD